MIKEKNKSQNKDLKPQIKVTEEFKGTRTLEDIIKYIGPQKEKNKRELTLELLYDLDNPYGFRDFDWEEFKMNPSLDKRTLKEQYAILKKEKLGLQRKKEFFFSKSD